MDYTRTELFFKAVKITLPRNTYALVFRCPHSRRITTRHFQLVLAFLVTPCPVATSSSEEIVYL